MVREPSLRTRVAVLARGGRRGASAGRFGRGEGTGRRLRGLAGSAPPPPFDRVRFTSRLRSEGVAARLGIALGCAFTLAFVTGLFSHFLQHPPSWLDWPSRPVWLYRLTQGLHVIGGLAAIPLLLAKLWTVYPRLWQWPPFRSVAHAVERGLVLLLVAGALFQLVTGLLNIAYIYPWPFSFPVAHYWTAFIVYGALIVHVLNEWAKVRRSVVTPVEPGRRGFLLAVAAACGVTVLATAGETVTPLQGLAVLAPRAPSIGPQGLPVNRTALAAGVSPADAGYRLTLTGGATPVELGYADLARLPQHTVELPIACVEGWSVTARWTGVRLADLMAMAGAPGDAVLTVESLETHGGYRTSEVRPPHWHDPLTLLALRVNGRTLHLDHGYPLRLIAPNRPGVQQTKWVHRIVIA
ncbi:molybdopterin-binding protein [Sphaerisporangium album]|uniref:Molybdopterin-binding protein n=1 Tax=Sphaerisporangium album TaxID=509200 RepID=A0A367FE01_9ACTN|nr:molybdopterin-dependent oxidoreductase [Sphaerisporangium album]RCG28596.1 molybdopterin-binding protein [Sphaerisporangium album]